VFPLAFQRTVDALNAGKSVIFDATNVSSFHRKQMLDYMKQNVSRDFDAYAKIFDADPEISKQRIRKDIEMGVDRSDVPDFAVDRQHQNFMKDLDKIEADGYKLMS
jgi:predicted kinase